MRNTVHPGFLQRIRRVVVFFVSLASLLGTGSAHADPLGPYSGRWALLQVTTTVANVPVIGRVYATTTAVSIHSLKQRGERLKGKGRICKLELDSGSSFVRTILPQALRGALPPPRVNGRLIEKDGVMTFTQARQTIVLGAKLEQLETDPLPSAISDPRIYDQDEDGHPGVTVNVRGIVNGDIRVVQRTWTELVAKRVTSDRIEGALRFGNEQVVLEATSSMLSSPPAAAPELARSHFRLVRLDASASCSTAVAATLDPE